MNRTEQQRMSLLQWTGHPLVDIGIATLCAMAEKDAPQTLSDSDLDAAAREMSQYYFSGLMNSYLTCVFMNSAYVQPAMKPNERAEYEKRVLYGHHWPGDEAAKGLRCAFSAEPATHLIHRGQMPLLTGSAVLNFFAHGTGGLPVGGAYLVAVQALPLGCRRTEGKLLGAASDDPAITLMLAKKYLADNRRLMELGKSNGLPNGEGPAEQLIREQAAYDKQNKAPKYPDAKSPTSLIAADLLDIYYANPWPAGSRKMSITAYWLSSSGQGPSLEIFQVPSQAVGFLIRAAAAPTGPSWKRLVIANWSEPAEKKVSEEKAVTKGTSSPKKPRSQSRQRNTTIAGGPGRSRNRVLADLFAVFESGFVDRQAAKIFIERHLLRLAKKKSNNALSEPKRGGAQMGINGPEWLDWALTGLFAKELLGMEEQRLQKIREFADKIADYVYRTNDRELFRNFVYGTKQWEIRNTLTKAQRNRAREHHELLFGLDEYLSVFLADDAIGKFDWGLVRDLISIRLVEQLFHKKFFEKENNQELLADSNSEPAVIQ